MYGNHEGHADESRYMTPEEVAHRKIAKQRERERAQKEEARNAELAALIARAEKAEAESKRKEQYLEAINDLMWNTWAIKGRRFGRDEGARIMEILESWASAQALGDKEPK